MIWLDNFWETYNSMDSWLPLYVPMVIWIGTFLYCYLPSKTKRPVFHKWYTLHNFHNFGAIVLGLISIYFNNDKIFNERIPILWSIGYFIVDVVECAWRLDGVYLLHGVFCLVLGVVNYNTPLYRELRMNSKATLCELSNPLMHLARKTRDPVHFAMFAAMFTCCRILWIPFMINQVRERGVPLLDPRQLILVGFYALNWFWYFKIIRIMVVELMGLNKRKE